MKSLVKRFLQTLMGGVVVCIVFTDCEHFLDGSEVKKTLEDQVKIAGIPESSVYVSALNSKYGVLVQEGENIIKEGVPFHLNFSTSSDYALERWTACDRNHQYDEEGKLIELGEDYVVFSDQTSEEGAESVNVTVKKNTGNILILPVCIERPCVLPFINEENEVYWLNRIALQFNEKVNLETKAYNFYMGTTTWPIVNANILTDYSQIEIKIKKHKGDNSYIDGNKCFNAEISGNNLYLRLLTAYRNNAMLEACILRTSSGDEEIEVPDTFYGNLCTGIDIRYVEIIIHRGIKGADSGTESLKDFVCGFYISGKRDTTAPFVKDVRFYMPEQDYILYGGIFNGSLVHHKRLFNKEEVFLNTCSFISYAYSSYDYIDNAADYVAGNDCREGFCNSFPYNAEYFPARIKDKFVFYCRAEDVQTDENDLIHADESAVIRLSYYLYRVTDKDGNINTSAIGTDYYGNTVINGWVPVYKPFASVGETSVTYTSGKYYDNFWEKNPAEDQVKQYLNENGGVAINLDLGYRNLEDGLYVLEAYPEDYAGNYGASGVYDEYYKSGYYEADKNLKWLQHNVQFYFVKDTVPPAATASDFKKPQNYWYSPATIGTLALPMDTSYFRSTDRKIVDAGTTAYNSLFTWRICSLSAFSDTPDGHEEKGWLETYGSDYVFEEVYEGENWIPENFAEGSHSIYVYVKDDVNNVGSQIEIADAFGYDSTAPLAVSFNESDYGANREFIFRLTEKLSGLKTIKVVTENSQNIAATISTIYSGSDENVDNKRNITSSGNTVILDSAVTDDYISLLINNVNLEVDNTIKIIFIDAAGNESGEYVYKHTVN